MKMADANKDGYLTAEEAKVWVGEYKEEDADLIENWFDNMDGVVVHEDIVIFYTVLEIGEHWAGDLMKMLDVNEDGYYSAEDSRAYAVANAEDDLTEEDLARVSRFIARLDRDGSDSFDRDELVYFYMESAY